MAAISSRIGLFVSALAMLVLPSTALARADQEVRGAGLVAAVERGQTSCGELGAGELTAIGELAMGRMAGSPRAHEAMDAMMARMMGADGLDRMHRAMGQRFAGCGRSASAGGFGAMMGMMGGAGGMMGGGPAGSATGGMMGFDRDRDEDGDLGAWILLVLLLVGLGAGAAVLLLARPRGRGSTSLDLLAARFARGELSIEDYEQRRRLLQGGGG